MTSRLAAAEVARLRSAALTYAERGQTQADLAAGYETVRVSRSIGAGSAPDERVTERYLAALHEAAQGR